MISQKHLRLFAFICGFNCDSSYLAEPMKRNRLTLAAFISLTVCSAVVSTNAVGADEKAPDVVERQGRLVRVPLPITGQTTDSVKRAARRALDLFAAKKIRGTLILDFSAPEEVQDAGRGSDFGAAYALARFLTSEELNGVTTVAYVPRSLQGHAVLPVLACDEIVIAPEASLGAAGVDEKMIAAPVRGAYAEIAARRRKVSVAVAIGLLDSEQEVLSAKTEAGTEYVLASDLPELKKKRTVATTEKFKTAGEVGSISGAEARRLGWVGFLASNKRELATALELPPAVLENDPTADGQWKAARFNLQGIITADKSNQIQKLIDEQIRRRGINFVCLAIDSPGGSLADSVNLANYLAFNLDPNRVRTVAYIAREARSDAALVALACDQIVMKPGAIFGGAGASNFSRETVAETKTYLRSRLAPNKGRTWSLPAAVFDSRLDVMRCSRGGETQFFCEEELKEQKEPDKWKKGVRVTTPGDEWSVEGGNAEEYLIANRTVNDFAEFRNYYGLSDDPTLVEPGWADVLIQALASDGVAVLLLIIGGAALYVELHAPGTGIGGFTAAICFALFFWSRYLGGTAGWLEGMLFLTGVAFLLLEIFVIPGFGIFGIGGGALIIASLVLASQTSLIPHNSYQLSQLRHSLLIVFGAAVGLGVVLSILRHWLPKAPLMNGMVLQPPEAHEAEVIHERELLVDLRDLVGEHGITTTMLMPGGKARFGDSIIDVIADGDAIERGRMIEAVEVRGNRVLVREVE